MDKRLINKSEDERYDEEIHSADLQLTRKGCCARQNDWQMSNETLSINP
jgi:hypothetical protein